jgi:catechol 2,3-dioxygenase-like lactoylglutathione lyase family enzyme
MIDHFEYKVTSFSECKQVYEAALAAIGIELKWADDAAAGFGLREDKDRVMLLLEQAAADGPPATTFHLAFGVSDFAQVDAFHAAALAAGGRCNGPPGPRPKYGPLLCH